MMMIIPISLEVCRTVKHMTRTVEAVAARSPNFLVVRLNVLGSWTHITNITELLLNVLYQVIQNKIVYG